MRGASAPLILLILTTLATGQEPSPSPPSPPAVKLPAEARGDVGGFVTVSAETNGKIVRWLPIDQGLSMFPVDLLKDTRTAIVFAARQGRYRLIAWTAVGDVPSEAAVCVVIVGDGPGPGPGPAPNPNPVPPAPNPNPPPPAPNPSPPADPFALTIQAAHASDLDPQKGAKVAALARVYRSAATNLPLPQNATSNDLYLFLVNARRATGLGENDLLMVRRTIATELQKSLPTNPATVLQPATITTAQGQFNRIATILEALR